MERAVEFLKNIEEKESILIIFHNDPDGVCSATLLKKYISSKNADVDLMSQPMPVNEDLINHIKTYLPDKIIIVDIAIDQQDKVLKQIAMLAPTLLIDHHQISKNMNGKRIIHHNPRFRQRNVYISASYICYKILNRLMDMSPYLWIAGIGMIGDYNLENSRDLVDKLKEVYPMLKKTKRLHDSLLGNIADMISAVKATKEISLEDIIKILDVMNSPDDLEKVKNGEKLIESYRHIENEILSIVVNIENEIKNNKFVLYELKSKYNLRSPLATRISEKHPKLFVAIYQKTGNKVKLSARRQEGGDICKILQEAAKGLYVSAGGHTQAAGATINTEDWTEFRKSLLELLEK